MGAWRGVAWLRRRVARVALAGALVAALCWGAPGAELAARAHFPAVAPHALAHLLADFSLQPNVSSWSVVEDGGNYSTWRYAVRYECGARCSGRAAVSAASEHEREPRHGPAARHRVAARLRACSHLPLLPWPTFCDEMQTEAVVSPGAGGEGTELVTSWRTRCDVLRALSGACAARLRAHHDALLLRVRAALQSRA